MSTMRQQFHPNSAKNLFRKQKSIDLNDKPVNDSKKILRKQLSVDHVTSGLKHASQTSAPINFGNLLWRNSTQSLNNEPNLRIVPTNAVGSQTASSKRAQFAANSINASSVLSKQELLTDCLNKSMKSVEATKTRVNINIFLSHDVPDDVFSDAEGTDNHSLNGKTSAISAPNASSKAGSNSEAPAASSGRLSVTARRAQFQSSRRIMSAPIRPMNIDDIKNKKKTRKKKVIRDKEDDDDSPDELIDEIESRKPALPQPVKVANRSKQLATRSKSVLGCDQIGIETLVSMLSSGGSDSEKDDLTAKADAAQAAPKPDAPKSRASMLRKTVSFQEDDSFLQQSVKDPFNNRRHSNVPFAGRMRNTRSLFGQEISNLYLPNNNDQVKALDTSEGNEVESSEKLSDGRSGTEKIKTKKNSETNSDDKKSQDNQTPKEQECWRLYEKMKKTGLNVSYDTILRGILKPSELRLLERQKKFLGDIQEKSGDDTVECQPEPQKVA